MYFSSHGVEDLITQLTGFGIGKHDDLADVFSLLLIKIMEEDNAPQPGIMMISMGSIYDRYNPLSIFDDEDRITLDKIF
jgi:hypothetical protein